MKKTFIFALVLACSGAAWAKLPAPVLTDEAKAKAAEAAAKTAHGNKVAAFHSIGTAHSTIVQIISLNLPNPAFRDHIVFMMGVRFKTRVHAMLRSWLRVQYSNFIDVGPTNL